ncbi:MAG: ABC transporter substrate-binding protein [Clostridia bacterium]|nr:ABC transporter substrate-binding protein [Clostridia bacterium]
MKKIISVVLAVITCLFCTVSCNNDDKEKLTKIRLNEVTHSIFYAPFYLAESLGYLEEEGIKLDLTNGGGADNVMSAVLSGDADVGFCGPETAIYVKIGGSTNVPTVFGQLTKRDGSFLVSRKNEPNFKWEDLKGKEILAGRKGGVPAMTFEYILGNHNLKNGVDLTLNYDVAFNLMTSAFEGGTADYCTMFEPTASEYEKAGKGYIVASVGEESGAIPYTCFIAKNSWLKKHGDIADGFLRAVTKAVKYVYETKPEKVAPLLTKYFASTSDESIISSLERYIQIDSWVKNMSMTEESFTRLQDVIENAGELEKKVAFSEVVDNTKAQKAYDDVYKKN